MSKIHDEVAGTHVEPEHGESFMDLLTSTPHWLFEITTSVVEALVTLLVAAILWPKFRAIGERLHKRFDKEHNLNHGKVTQSDLDLLDAVYNSRPKKAKVGPNPFVMQVTEQPVGECMDCGLNGGHVMGCSSVGLAVVLDTSQPAKRFPKNSDLEISSSEHLRVFSNVHSHDLVVERMILTERMNGRDVYRAQTLAVLPEQFGIEIALELAVY